MLGTVACVVLAFVRGGRFHRALRLAKPASEQLVARTRCMSETLGLRKPPGVRTVSALVSPMVWPIGKATIIVPEKLIEELAPDELSMLIGHELVHLRR